MYGETRKDLRKRLADVSVMGEYFTAGLTQGTNCEKGNVCEKNPGMGQLNCLQG